MSYNQLTHQEQTQYFIRRRIRRTFFDHWTTPITQTSASEGVVAGSLFQAKPRT